MQEVIRKHKRTVLSRAVSMTISVDDKSEHRLIKYKTNLDCPYSHGVLSVMRYAGSASTCTLQDFDDDYSERMAESVLTAVKQFCTPLDCDMDTALYCHIKQIVRVFTADGASSVQKCGRILVGAFPNLTLILRDPCHSIRPRVY
jgi:hypothetical protein